MKWVLLVFAVFFLLRGLFDCAYGRDVMAMDHFADALQFIILGGLLYEMDKLKSKLP